MENAAMIEFGDGVAIDPNGDLRVEEVGGQYYVLGDGMMFPAAGKEVADQLLADIVGQQIYLNMKVLKSPAVRERVKAVLEGIYGAGMGNASET